MYKTPKILLMLFCLYSAMTALAQDITSNTSPELSFRRIPQNIASTNADPNWRPTAAQIAAVEGTTRSYFAARDANQFEDAYVFLSPRQKALQPLSAFQKRVEEFNARAGQVQSRRLRAFTWYKDSPQGGPGLFVAVDYSSEFPNLALHCGYVAWEVQADGRLLQVREEENMIDKTMMSKLTPEALSRVRAEFKC